MRAMLLEQPAEVKQHPLRLVDRAAPIPGPGELLVQVEACGVCRTDLHVVEGDLAPKHPAIVPGHQVVGIVRESRSRAGRFALGDRVGVAWLHESCGHCRFCERGDENLCLHPQFTGWDVDGGYAELLTVPEDFVYGIPAGASPVEIAPLLCAGIIGYRAYLRSGIQPGGRLGLYGFGGSAHITIQVAKHFGCEVYVFSRGGGHRELAESLGASWVGATDDPPPAPLDAAILFAPAGEIVPHAMAALDRGGVLAIAGIHLSDVPPLHYQKHLFQEREIRSVTANTREDGRALLQLATEIPIQSHTKSYALSAANEALEDLKSDRIRGAAVLDLRMNDDGDTR
jgi:propanol-preferring alcohol dehydrogenase